jgi:putative hemolysin
MVNLDQISILPRLLAFPIPKPVEGALHRVLGIRELQTIYTALRETGADRPICERLIDHLEITYRASQRDQSHIPRTGPAVLVVNHPFGILEGAVIATALGGIRSDVKFLANGVLAVVPEIRSLLIPVDPAAGPSAIRGNCGGLRQALRFISQGGMVVVFPAGEVSHFQWKKRSITDPPWNPAIARLLEIAARKVAGIAVVPVYVEGANSLLFQILGLLHPRLRTALLVREFLNKRKSHVCLRAGGSVAADKLLAIPTDEERTQYLRWRTYLLASRQDYKPATVLPLRKVRATALQPVVEPIAPAALSREVNALPSSSTLAVSGELSVYLANARQIPSVLAEIGRLRELTFRSVGEGTGNASDVDTFDSRYLHLFVWNGKRQEVVGAYRLAATDQVSGLYTATLFGYSDKFLHQMGPALELGRSFIRAEYQRAFAPLLLLWRGIGKYVSQNPRYKMLFGPVSISNQYQSISRELMVSFLERHASIRDWAGLVSVRNPFRPRKRGASTFPATAFDIEELSSVVSDLEPSQTGVPVLLRQYLKLGGKLLGFNVDPKFSNALDGLILVDLTKTEPKLLERYFGKPEAAKFLAFQRGTIWNSAKAC